MIDKKEAKSAYKLQEKLGAVVAYKNISKNKIKLKKIKGATGYKIQYSTNKKFKKKVRTIKTKKTTYKIKKLKKGKTYYIRYKAYKNSSEGQVSTDWSKTKKIKLKK